MRVAPNSLGCPTCKPCAGCAFRGTPYSPSLRSCSWLSCSPADRALRGVRKNRFRMQFAFSRATRPHKNGLRAAGARRALVHAAGDRKESAARKTRHGSSKGVGEDLSKILLVASCYQEVAAVDPSKA